MPEIPQSELDQLEDLLVAEIPAAVTAAKIKEPVYCLRIWYNGTSSSLAAVPWLMLIKETTRQNFIAKHGDRAAGKIWCADEATYPGQAIKIELRSDRLRKLYAIWYRYLCDVEDDQELQLFREAVQRAARKLNGLRWSEYAPVTDDFVIFPADGSHTFCDDSGDMAASLTPGQLGVLRTRNLV